MSIEATPAKLRPFDFTTIIASEGDDPNHPLAPIFATDGLVFPITPNVTETVAINYDSQEIPHTNEAFNVYRGTDNRNINLGNVIFPCDNNENARYALAAIHFFRTYSLMDFGTTRTGRPPSPMHFSAFGKYSFDEVPVLMKGFSITHSDMDIDLMKVTNPGDEEDLTWLPAKLAIGDISLVVQHSPNYWRGIGQEKFSLTEFRNGDLIRNR